MSTTASPPGLPSFHWRTRPLKPTIWTSLASQRCSADIPGELVFDEAAQRLERLLERALDQAGEFVRAGRIEWFKDSAQDDGGDARFRGRRSR
jgi:hypothetical protein